MAVSLFGLKVNVEDFDRQGLPERLSRELAGRRFEQRLIRRFLEENTKRGSRVISEMETEAEAAIDRPDGIGGRIGQQLFGYARKELERMKSRSGVSMYQDMVLQVVDQESGGRVKKTARKMRMGYEYAVKDLPEEFPGYFKRAEMLVNGKLRSDLGSREERSYLVEQKVRSMAEAAVRDLGYGLENGLSEEQALRFVRIGYELERLETAGSVNRQLLKAYLTEAIRDRSVLNLVHVKCLRFVYPKTGGVEVLEDTEDRVVEGVRGKYAPKSEQRLPGRLKQVKEVLEENGVETNFTLICADEDLELLFPDGNEYVSPGQKVRAEKSAQAYAECLKTRYGQEFQIQTINGLKRRADGRYATVRRKVLQDLAAGGGRYVSPGFFERDRVDHQYQYYQQLLGSGYTRAEARRSMSEQTASMIALGELLKQVGERVILVEENRYGENNLIAGGSVPVLFVKLRDEAKFDVK